MDLELKGLSAVVTGGTRGIGRAIAAGFAAEGCNLAICARQPGEVEDAAAALRQTGVTVLGQALDVADHAALTTFVQGAAAALGGLDIVVANVSAMASGVSPDAFRRSLEVDVLHTAALVTAAEPHLERSRAPAIVAIASISGVEDYGYDEAAYGALKAALLFYVKSLSGHLARKGIRANVVSPGTTYFEGGFWHNVEQHDPELFTATIAKNPMGRMASPADIANAVLFVASPAASFITGANLVVDGGFTRRVQN